MTLIVETFTVGEFQQNARVLVDRASNKALIIDPGAEEQRLFDYCSDFDVEAIFLTHCHLDHAGAVQRLLALFEVSSKPVPNLMYHSNEIVIAEHIAQTAMMYGIPGYDDCPKPDKQTDDMKELYLGDTRFDCLFTPGHSPGHVALYCEAEQLLIAGDALFQGSIGRTDLPFGNHEQLIQSIKEKLLVLPDDTQVCPGHGPNTTIGQEKRSNPFLV